MYCIATLHPDLVEARRPDYRGAFFTQEEKRRLIREFYEKRLEIPLCIDHCGATTCGFVVPEAERIGRVCDLFNDEKGQLMVKLKLDNTHHAYARINRGIDLNRELWGVSVWIDYYDSGRKALTHVALTTDPLFAAHGTWLHQRGLEDHVMDRHISRHFYKEGRGQCFAAPDYQRRLADCHLTPRQRREKQHPGSMSQQQLPAAQNDQQFGDDEIDEISQDEQQQQEDGSSMQTEEPVSSPALKTGNSGVDQNNRSTKRVRHADQQAQQQAENEASSSGLLPYKTGDKIDFNDFMDVKGQYDIYAAHIENSKVPYNRLPVEFKRTYNQLEDKMTEIKRIAMEFIDTVEQKKYLPPAIANDYRCAMSDHNTNAKAQENVLGFVAAGRYYADHNANVQVAEIRLENNSLKEQIKQLQAQQQPAPVPTPQTRRAPSQTRTPKQSQPLVKEQPLSSGRTVQAPQYGKWIDDVGGSTRALDQTKLTQGQAAIANCFNDMFQNSF